MSGQLRSPLIISGFGGTASLNGKRQQLLGKGQKADVRLNENCGLADEQARLAAVSDEAGRPQIGISNLDSTRPMRIRRRQDGAFPERAVTSAVLHHGDRIAFTVHNANGDETQLLVSYDNPQEELAAMNRERRSPYTFRD